MSVSFEITTGNLLDQKVEVIVNAWNSNRIPWWLLQPHGVSDVIKRHGGVAPFRELQAYGALVLGQAFLTGTGQLPYKGIIHLASITLWGSSSAKIIYTSVVNVLALAQGKAFKSIAFPILGSGSGCVNEQDALTIMTNALQSLTYDGMVQIVRYRSNSSGQ